MLKSPPAGRYVRARRRASYLWTMVDRASIKLDRQALTLLATAFNTPLVRSLIIWKVQLMRNIAKDDADRLRIQG